MSAKKAIVSRSEQAPAALWSIKDLFPGDEASVAALEACQDLTENIMFFVLS